MKKYFAVLMVVAGLLAVSCGKDNNGGGSTKDPQTQDDSNLPASLKGTNYYPILLDSESAEVIKDKIVLDLRPSAEQGRNLDIWAAGETYAAGEAPGTNFYGHSSGYTHLVCVAPEHWSGGGIAHALAADLSKFADIAAHPDQYYFHVGYKGKANDAHLLRVFGLAGEEDVYNFAIGQGSVTTDKGTFEAIAPVDGEFEASEWLEYEISMQKMGLNFTGNAPFVYIVTFLSGDAPGAELALDAMFIYKK